MKSRSLGLLVLAVLAAGLYGLGWLIGSRVNVVLRTASRSSAPTPAPAQTESPVVAASTAEADPGARAEAERLAALRTESRAKLQTLQAEVLRLEQARKPYQAIAALRDLRVMLRSLAPEDFPAVWQWFGQLKSPVIRPVVESCLVSAWSRVDPRAALAAVLALPHPTAWDMGEGSRYVVGRINGPLWMVLSRWAETDPAAALAEAKQVTGQNGADAIRIVENTISGLGRLTLPDPDTALAQAQAMTNDVASKNPDNPTRAQAFEKAFGAYVGAGRTAEAVAFVTSLPESEERQRLVSGLARQWAYVDLPGATAWANQVTGDASLCKAVWDGLKDRWARVDPAGAVQFALAAFIPGEARTMSFSEIAGRSLGSSTGDVYGDDVAWNLTQQLPGGPERDAVAAALCNRWLEYAPEQAARMIASMTPGNDQTRLAIQAASQWAIWDPASASAWAVSFPAGPARDTALAAVAQQWAGNDAPAASDWLQTLPAGSAQARAAESYVDKIVNQYPELAARWVALIADDQTRTQQVQKIGQQWLTKDPTAARAWLEATQANAVPKP